MSKKLSKEYIEAALCDVDKAHQRKVDEFGNKKIKIKLNDANHIDAIVNFLNKNYSVGYHTYRCLCFNGVYQAGSGGAANITISVAKLEDILSSNYQYMNEDSRKEEIARYGIKHYDSLKSFDVIEQAAIVFLKGLDMAATLSAEREFELRLRAAPKGLVFF